MGATRRGELFGGMGRELFGGLLAEHSALWREVEVGGPF